MQQLQYIKNIYHLYFSDILLLFSFLSSLENQYMNHHVWHLLYNSWTESKIKPLPLTDVSKPTWYLERSDLKSSLTIVFALSSTFLEEMKLILIVNWIFHVSYFWRLIIIFLKLGLILSKYSFTDRFLFLSLLLSYSI